MLRGICISSKPGRGAAPGAPGFGRRMEMSWRIRMSTRDTYFFWMDFWGFLGGFMDSLSIKKKNIFQTSGLRSSWNLNISSKLVESYLHRKLVPNIDISTVSFRFLPCPTNWHLSASWGPQVDSDDRCAAQRLWSWTCWYLANMALTKNIQRHQRLEVGEANPWNTFRRISIQWADPTSGRMIPECHLAWGNCLWPSRE